MCQIFSESRVFWKHFITFHTRGERGKGERAAAAPHPHLQWENGDAQSHLASQSGMGPGPRATLAGGATLRPAFASVAPSARWEDVLAAGPGRCVSVGLPPTQPAHQGGLQAPSPTRSIRGFIKVCFKLAHKSAHTFIKKKITGKTLRL